MHWAAGKGHSKAVSYLLKHGLDPNTLSNNGLPAVIMAAVALSDETVCTLVDAGANVGYILSGNLTLLHICAEYGLENAVKSILKVEDGLKCCDVETDDGNSPIHLAAMGGYRNIVEILHAHGKMKVIPGETEYAMVIDAVMEDGKNRMKQWEQDHAKPADSQSNGVQADAGSGRVLEPTNPAENEEASQKADQLKDQGNKCFTQKKYADAITLYSQAIVLRGDNAVVWSNRSACYLALGDASNALLDAEVCRRLDPKWPKGCYRLAAARLALKQYEDAAVAAFEGCKLDDSNEELKSLMQKAVKLGKEEFQEKQKKSAK